MNCSHRDERVMWGWRRLKLDSMSSRFQRLKTDPRFRKPRKHANKVEIDPRFRSVLQEGSEKRNGMPPILMSTWMTDINQ
jgi:hypothetical protein